MTQSIVLLILIACPVWAAWQAGAASVDITPKESIWLAGYAARTQPSQSVRLPIHAKALALKDDAGAVSVVVTLDIVGIRREITDEIAARAAKELGVPRERILFNVSHTHSAPLVGDSLSYTEAMGRYAEAQKLVLSRYTAALPALIYEAIAKSVANLQSSTIAFEQGYAGFAVNRRRVGHREFPGPVDHDVPVLAIRNSEGRVIAILFGYACHNTVMGDYSIHGDYAGYSQAYLEQRFPGAIALFVQGAGADANPLPRGKPEHLERYGATLADAVEQVINGKMKPLSGTIRAAMELQDVAFEGPFSRSRWEEESASSNARMATHGRRMLALLESKGSVPETRPYTVQAWQFADGLTLIALAGELTVDYALKFKSRYGANTTWIAGYSNDVFGYIPSLRVWKEGGYEGGEAFLFSGFPGRFSPDIEERITTAVERVVARVRQTPN
jgi:neutral ceramidase